MVDSVLTDTAGTPTGLKLRNPYYLEYVEITDFVRIYFLITAAHSAKLL